MTTTTREWAQRAADACLELAQAMEREAKAYRERAKHYRSGALDVGYSNLPPEAGDRMRHPAARALDELTVWGLVAKAEQLRADLKKDPSTDE